MCVIIIIDQEQDKLEIFFDLPVGRCIWISILQAILVYEKEN
jgi:hypothetical protein